MLKDNALGNRLNAVKEGNPIPEPVIADEQLYPKFPFHKLSLKEFFINEAYKTFQIITTSILYGFGISAIFTQTWSFIEIFGVGIIANHIFLNIINFSSKLFKN